MVDRSAMVINRFLNPEEEEEVVEPPVPKEILDVVIEEVVGTPESSTGKRHGVMHLTEGEDEDEEMFMP